MGGASGFQQPCFESNCDQKHNTQVSSSRVEVFCSMSRNIPRGRDRSGSGGSDQNRKEGAERFGLFPHMPHKR
jgi:hypothetical protein